MTAKPTRNQSMEDIEIHFNAPKDAAPAELAAYLDEACGGDVELRAQVEALFEAERTGGEFMAQPPMDEIGMTDSGGAPAEDVGQTIGNYKLLQRIGEGGFGSVYMAEQSAPVKRRVAFKVIKLGMDTKQVIARFEIERQALAMMDHPNIAKVYDAGATATGRPYFVMELVRGIPISRFCEEGKLDTAARLALFIEVCGAVQHAHQKGIIHRDLKPSNVIVTMHDDRAVPKVIDFGVAKATQQDLTDKTLFTKFEQFIGTPAYMSPEQAQMSGLDIDTRSDIYSLGVLLYELLTGTTPFDGKDLARAGRSEICRLISEEQPPKPSTRLTEIQRRTLNTATPKLAGSSIDRELDWIVMRAMEKDRTRRYDTAKGLALDIRRHLDGQPVEAAAPGVWYRFQKYARRHRAALGAAAAIAFALIAGTVVSIWQALEADAARQVAERAERLERAAKVEATRLAREAKHTVVEEQLSAGKTKLGIAKLAQLIREDETNRVAAARLLSALQLREFPKTVQQFPIAYAPDFSPDGSMVITTTADEQGFQIWDVESGRPVGKPLRDPSGRKPRSTDRGARFHPTRPLVATFYSINTPESATAQIWDYRTGEPVGAPISHPRSLYFVIFSPDGRFVLTGDGSGETRVTEVGTGKLQSLIPRGRYPGSAFCCAVSPDSQSYAVKHLGRVHIIDLASGKEIGVAIQHPSRLSIYAVSYSPDGRLIATASGDHSVRLWHAGTGLPTGTVFQHDDRVVSVEFSPDSELLLSASNDKRARVWDVASGELLSAPAVHETLIASARFDSDGKHFVTASAGSIQVWDVGTGQPSGAQDRTGMDYRLALFRPGGNSILASGPGGASRLIRNLPSPPQSLCFHHPLNPNWGSAADLVPCATFSPDRRLVASAGVDGHVRIWDARSGQPVRVLQLGDRNSRPVWVEFNPDGSLLLAASSSGRGIQVWSTADWEQVSRITAAKICRFATFAPVRDEQGRWRILNSGSVAPQIWDALTGEPLGEPLDVKLRGTRTMVDTVDFSPDGSRIVTTSNGSEAIVWDANTSQLERRLDGDFGQEGHSDFVRSAMFSPDGERILTCGNDETARIWETETGKQLCPPMEHGDDVTYAAFSPDGRLVVTVSRDTTARVWDSASGRPVGVPMQHGAWVGHAAFDPTGERVVTASNDGTARVWDSSTGFPLSEPLQHGGNVYYATFSPDGSRVLTAGQDSTARLWEIPPVPDHPVPTWLAEWAEAIVGLRLHAAGNATELAWTNPTDVEKWARDQAAGDEFYGQFVNWFYADHRTRAIAPYSAVTLDDYVERRMRERDIGGNPEQHSLEEVLHVKPDHVPAYVGLAKLLLATERGDPASSLRRARYYAQLATSADPLDPRNAELLAAVQGRRRLHAEEPRLAAQEALAGRMIDAGNLAAARELLIPVVADRLGLIAGSGPDAEEEFEWGTETWTKLVEAEHPPLGLVGRGTTWRYLDTALGDPPGDWRTPGFDHSQWEMGAAQLGFKNGAVTELQKGEPGNERMSFYFRRNFTLAGDDAILPFPTPSLLLRLMRDDGAVVYLNGEEILRSNMPQGEIRFDTPAATVVGGTEETRFFDYSLPLQFLQTGENLLAVEVHQANPGSSDVSFDLELSLGQDPLPSLRKALAELLDPKDHFLFEGTQAISLGELTPEQLVQRSRIQRLLGDPEAALDALDASLARLAESYEPANVRRRKELQRNKAEVLREQGREEQAAQVREEITAVPPRDPGLSPKMLDLAMLYHASLFPAEQPAEDSSAEAMELLAETFDPGDGPAFDLRGKIQLNSGLLLANRDASAEDFNARTKSDCPMRVEIPVAQSCRAIHFLHTCRWGREEIGAEVARYVIHFGDGTSDECKVFFGTHMMDFWIHGRPAEELSGIRHFAWKHKFKTESGNGTLALTRQTWENPHPDKIITHIEFISAGAKAAPMLVAVTVE